MDSKDIKTIRNVTQEKWEQEQIISLKQHYFTINTINTNDII